MSMLHGAESLSLSLNIVFSFLPQDSFISVYFICIVSFSWHTSYCLCNSFFPLLILLILLILLSLWYIGTQTWESTCMGLIKCVNTHALSIISWCIHFPSGCCHKNRLVKPTWVPFNWQFKLEVHCHGAVTIAGTCPVCSSTVNKQVTMLVSTQLILPILYSSRSLARE